jgi:glycosyltransferase involved in cell wall biosynthesis
MTTDAVGGVWTYALDLGRGLAARGIETVLAVMGPAPSPSQRAAAGALGLTLEHAPLRLEWMNDPWRDVETAGDWLLALEQRHGCDFVHLNGYVHARCPFRSPKLVVAHSCVLSWWEAVLREPAPAHWARYRAAVAEGLAAAALVVSPSHWMSGAIARHYGAAGRSIVIPNSRPPGVFAAGGKQPYVLGAGRVWDEAKNLKALALAGRSLPWPVKIAGPIAPPRADGEAAASNLDAEAFEGTQLLGAVPAGEMAELYAHAPIFAAPALYEPFGLTVLEAALSGCALVLGDIPSLRELWEDAAVFVPPRDAAALGACLHDLVRHPELRHEMGLEARARAARFSHDETIDAYIHAYARAYVMAGIDAPSPTRLGAPPEERGCTS